MAKKSSISGDYDNLLVGQLRGPLLDRVMQSQIMRNELMNVAREIKTRYIAKVPKDTGALSKTVRIKPFRAETRDRRWYVDVTIGGIMGVDYADKIEAQYHVLGGVLRDMGYNVGDFVYGPRGKGAKEAPDRPKKRASKNSMDASISSDGYSKLAAFVDKIQRPGRRLGSKAYDADYESLQKLTQEVEDQYGRDQAAVGRMFLSAYEQMREAKGMSREPFIPDQNNFRLVWFELNKDGKQVRKSKFFNSYEQAKRYGETDVAAGGKAVPNSPRFNRYQDDRKYSSGILADNGANLFGVIMNEKGITE